MIRGRVSRWSHVVLVAWLCWGLLPSVVTAASDDGSTMFDSPRSGDQQTINVPMTIRVIGPENGGDFSITVIGPGGSMPLWLADVTLDAEGVATRPQSFATLGEWILQLRPKYDKVDPPNPLPSVIHTVTFSVISDESEE